MKSYDTENVSMRINNKDYTFTVSIGNVAGMISVADSLAHTLRELLLLTGTKTPCNKGECGGCTVLIGGEPRLACSALTVECDGMDIVTIEGLRNQETGELHPIQQAFIDVDAIQCGMCTPGITLTAKALLDKNPSPDEKEIRDALAGNICRCTGYVKYIDGVLLAARRMREAE